MYVGTSGLARTIIVANIDEDLAIEEDTTLIPIETPPIYQILNTDKKYR